MLCVYILFSSKLNKYYVGSTNDLQRRFSEHSRGHVKATRTGRPWIITGAIPQDSLLNARKEELRIKSWKDKKYILQLIKKYPFTG